MVIAYSILICLSALIGAWAGIRTSRRLMPMLGRDICAGASMLLPALGFLMVVGAPAPMLAGATLLFAALALRPRRDDSIAVMLTLLLATVLIGLTGLPTPTAPYLAALPPLAAFAAAGLLWLGIAGSGWFSSQPAPHFAYGLLASLAALAPAPLLAASAHTLTLDSAIVASAVVGALIAGCRGLHVGTASRMGVAFLLAGLQIMALWHGAWIAALASISIWIAAALWAWAQRDPLGDHHAI
jgi:hypothetical protein